MTMNQEIITRDEAIKRGLKRFYTGVQCKNGHTDERYVSTRTCATCMNDHNKRNKAKNPRKKYEYNENRRKAWNERRAARRAAGASAVDPTSLRGAALIAGATTFMGAPCKRGHTGERYVTDGQCCDCKRARNRGELSGRALLDTPVDRARQAARAELIDRALTRIQIQRLLA